jgi:CRP-like cAMP-binding protein
VTSQIQGRDVTILFGFLSQRKNNQVEDSKENGDVAKLFFDSFSRRVSTVEDGLKTISDEIAKVRLSIDRCQLSDLVLLERLQKTEGLVRESLNLTNRAIEASREANETAVTDRAPPIGVSPASTVHAGIVGEEAAISRRILAPAGELGSLSSITTPTELQVLAMLANEGPKSAPEIGRVVGRSREHTARLMKKLYEEGYIRRDQTRIPFRYSVVERVKQSLVNQETKDAEREPISVPQT